MKIHELGHVVLYVSNLERSANFYRDTLGFKELSRLVGSALYSAGRTHHELLLIEVGTEPKEKDFSPGLYHIGFKVGETDAELKEAYETVKRNGVTVVGMADHYVTHSLYVLDPDGNELELYVDINDEWKRDPLAVLRPTRPLKL